MSEDWLARWEAGRIGWHEAGGNAGLKAHWPELEPGSRVLVPFCGKSIDLVWLAGRGLEVTGVELSTVAVAAFFDENGLAYERDRLGDQERWRASDMDLSLVCGDYMAFADQPFDALYDRGALVAVPAGQRPAYVRHTDSLLAPDAFRLVITLEYPQSRVEGPPYAVMPDELERYWPGLVCVSRHNDIDNAPPKFRDAGLAEFLEAVWIPRRCQSPGMRPTGVQHCSLRAVLASASSAS